MTPSSADGSADAVKGTKDPISGPIGDVVNILAEL